MISLAQLFLIRPSWWSWRMAWVPQLALWEVPEKLRGQGPQQNHFHMLDQWNGPSFFHETTPRRSAQHGAFNLAIGKHKSNICCLWNSSTQIAKHCAPMLRRWEAWVLVQSCWFWDRHGIRNKFIGNKKQGSKQEGKKKDAGKEVRKEGGKEAGKEAGLERNRTGSGTCSFFKGDACCSKGGWVACCWRGGLLMGGGKRSGAIGKYT